MPEERRLRHFIVEYRCHYCPHYYQGHKKVGHHEFITTGFTVGEAVLKAEKDPYNTPESIIGVREKGVFDV